MSDAVKPEDTNPVVVEPSKPAEEVAAVSETVAAPVTTTDDVTPVATDKPAEETAAAEEKKEDDKPEPKEITQGTLSKIPSGLMSIFKMKRFFYFQDEPIPEDKLMKGYLQKTNSTRTTAAHASQTGKGLLLYSKAEGQSPHGIIKLADATEVTPDGATKFVLKTPTGDLHFESLVERDNWVFTLNHKITEAKAIDEEIVNSEGYKATLERLTKPSPIAAAKAPEKPTDAKEEKETEEAKPEEDAEKVKTTEAVPAVTSDDEAGPSDKKTDVKRSPSKNKKRTSVFAFLKKEKVEEKKEESAEKDETKEDPKAVEPTTATTDGLFMTFNFEDGETNKIAAPAEVPVVAGAKEAEDVKPGEETKEAEKATEAPVAPRSAKRHSYFNVNVFNREKKEKEVAEDKKEEEAKTEDEAGPAEVKPVDVVAPEASTTAEKSPASSPPKSKFYSAIFDKKEKKTEKEHETKPAEAATEPIAIPAITTNSTAAPAEEPAVAEATSPTTSPKEQKRKSSFFSFKKEKKADDVKSDTEEGEASSPKASTSPVPKPGLLTGLMRKASKAGKGKETEAKEVVAPATVSEETAPATTTETETPNGAPAAAEPSVVPEAVPVGQAHPVQAAA
ncbi:hypothetical protein L873DRAFT_1833925 [Choiromyces venosus 120613-1]|uniref:Meiotic expression up-regulated protein 6 PH domain-containing protein n=1 Tax=Choiromyces venosus 120613-1 TaxID=1336337 RepID=A0A3N4JXT2_9PEZI|nr:hypothetical protein L873DRAFT_1833925 [Choiromyces venosus 120613-1]